MSTNIDNFTAWDRIKKHAELREKAVGMPETWDSVKILINGKERMKDIYSIEKDYLDNNPHSGYLTEILGLETFPDYIEYLPHNAIPRKVKVMAYIPQKEVSKYPYIGMSREEYESFLDNATELVVNAILLQKKKLF